MNEPLEAEVCKTEFPTADEALHISIYLYESLLQR